MSENEPGLTPEFEVNGQPETPKIIDPLERLRAEVGIILAQADLYRKHFFQIKICLL
jgi:hypothetical protein